MKTKVKIEVSSKLCHHDLKDHDLKAYSAAFISERKTTEQIEVEVPDEVITVLKTFSWGSNELVVSISGQKILKQTDV